MCQRAENQRLFGTGDQAMAHNPAFPQFAVPYRDAFGREFPEGPKFELLNTVAVRVVPAAVTHWIVRSIEEGRDCGGIVDGQVDLIRYLMGALAKSKCVYDGRPIARVFDETTSDLLRWDVCDAFATSRPRHIDAWLEATALNAAFGPSRKRLMVAVARLLPRGRACDILCECLKDDAIVGHCADGLKRCGYRPKDIRSLEGTRDRLASKLHVWERKEIDKAIKKIIERL